MSRMESLQIIGHAGFGSCSAHKAVDPDRNAHDDTGILEVERGAWGTGTVWRLCDYITEK
jgi:hypothetical protein